MNIDKDIDRLKELQSTIYEGGDYIYLNKNDKQALGNVLTEFQGLRDFSTETVRRSAELQVELETYKKIAKRLAKEILLQYPEMFNMVTVNNIEMVIDEARKEVENES